ncbi:MAG: magnesium transporter [Alistipes sp.]|uniref:magnesium transporter n=1 Tax=Alistipes sp. TaxID=1872444 RepID=UPI0023F2097E|nr:magnesium transporter [Alistipes sp.]MBQ7892620.1 magnesium transporter [Alistipes sp.]
MDFRKINSYVILLAIVVVVGLLMSMVARLVILAKGADTGTANLVFIIVMGICMIFYLTVMAAFSSVADFVADKIFPKIAGKNLPTAESEIIEPADNISENDIEHIKQEADKRFIERQREQIELFRRYAHREVGPYITSNELVRLDRYIEHYALQKYGPTELTPIRPQKLKNADLFHFGWNMAHYFGRPKQEVVPWLKSAFVPLTKLEDSYVKGKLYSPQTRQFIIPNIADIPQYMAEHDR